MPGESTPVNIYNEWSIFLTQKENEAIPAEIKADDKLFVLLKIRQKMEIFGLVCIAHPALKIGCFTQEEIDIIDPIMANHVLDRKEVEIFEMLLNRWSVDRKDLARLLGHQSQYSKALKKKR